MVSKSALAFFSCCLVSSLKEVLFCGLADLVHGSCELGVWSNMWPGPELKTDRTGAFADVFF